MNMESAQQTYHGDMSASHAFIPRLGFGTFQSESHGNQHDIVKTAVLNALKVGYRHIDTAYAYGNGSVERAVGQAIRECGIPRSEIYLVTKLHNTFHHPEAVHVGLERSLANLETDYVDLYLMHNPIAYSHDDEYGTVRTADGSGKPLIDMEMSRRYPDTWKAMHSILETGKIKQIGVSNFNVLKLKRLIHETGIIPTANQVEMNPYLPQHKLREFCQQRGILVIAHSPLGGAPAAAVAGRKEMRGPLQDTYVKTLSQKYHRTPAQIVLNWLLSLGVCAVPKSAQFERIVDNFNCQDVNLLSPEEIQVMSNLTGEHEENAVRNLQPRDHIGFDMYDEEHDQPL